MNLSTELLLTELQNLFVFYPFFFKTAFYYSITGYNQESHIAFSIFQFMTFLSFLLFYDLDTFE